MRFPISLGAVPLHLPADDAGAAPAPSPSPGGGAPATGGTPVGGGGGTPSGGNGSTPVFAETLPEDIRGDAAFRDIKDLGSLAKSYLHAQKLIGRDPKSVLALPGAEDQKGWAEIYDRLGRPPAPDKYQLKAPQLPEGLTVNENLQKNYASKAWELGLTEKQVAGLYEWWNGQGVDAHKAATELAAREHDTNVATLKGEYGAAYDAKIDLAHRALAHYGDDALVDYLDKTKLGNDPAMVRLFVKLGEGLTEDGVIGKAGGGGRQGALSPGEAQQEIAARQRDQVFMKDYQDKRSPGHDDALATMQRLYGFAYPEG
jgi:hypothetical protein